TACWWHGSMSSGRIGIFRERNSNRITQPIAKQRPNSDGALDAAILALARFGYTQVNRIIPIRPELIEPRHQQAVTFDHHLRIARLHREHEIVITMLASDACELQRA